MSQPTEGTGASARKQVQEAFPDIAPLVILKADVQRRTVRYTPQALARVDPAVHQLNGRWIYTEKADSIPESLLLRDGTSILTAPLATAEDPYLVDVVDGRTVLMDQGEVMEDVEFWTKPDFYDKFTSSGKPMWHIAHARPQRIEFNPYSNCRFWDNGKGCKFCGIASTYTRGKRESSKPLQLDLRDIAETMQEAVKQKGRFTSVFLTGGSIPQGPEVFDEEVDLYVDVLQAIGVSFGGQKFPSQLLGSAFSLKQLERLYSRTGIMSYTSDIEVLDPELFSWICPGKSEWLGYGPWKQRIVDAVGIFGKGFVTAGLVGGVELARPNGFPTEAAALKATLQEAEALAQKGVGTVACVWVPYQGTVFHRQKVPSLHYYIALARGLQRLRDQYGISIEMDNYRRCGNHPDSDLGRI